MLTSLAHPTPESLKSRRHHLRQQRSRTLLQGSWRLTLTLALLGGLVAVVRLPNWQIERASQIAIEGNRLMSDDAIQAQLPLRYPINLWNVEVQNIEQALTHQQNHATLVKGVHLQRKLLPPGLTLWVQERIPVALSQVNGQPGMVDNEGEWIPLNQGSPLAKGSPPLTLTVLGWENHLPQEWRLLLTQVQTSGIPIQTVDWKGTDQLVLQTALGEVRLGSYIPDRLAQQLQTLARMRQLQHYCDCDPKTIEFIDLTSPLSPSLQMLPGAAEARLQQLDAEGNPEHP